MLVDMHRNLESFEHNEGLAKELYRKLTIAAGQERIKIKTTERLRDELKELCNKFAVNRSEFYRNLSFNDPEGSFMDSKRS